MECYQKIIKFFRRKPRFKYIGRNVTIKRGYFGGEGNIRLGDNIYIGPDAYWEGTGGIIVENNVIIGPKSKIWTVNHNYESEVLLPYDEVDFLLPVIIKSNVWIGLGVAIVPGITIGEGSVIAMGSVITKNVPKLAVVGGNPARVLKYRNNDNYERIKTRSKYSYLQAKAEGLKKRQM